MYDELPSDVRLAYERQAHLAQEFMVPSWVEIGPPGAAVMVTLQPDVMVAVPMDTDLSVTAFRVDTEDTWLDLDREHLGDTPGPNITPETWAEMIATRVPEWRLAVRES